MFRRGLRSACLTTGYSRRGSLDGRCLSRRLATRRHADWDFSTSQDVINQCQARRTSEIGTSCLGLVSGSGQESMYTPLGCAFGAFSKSIPLFKSPPTRTISTLFLTLPREMGPAAIAQSSPRHLVPSSDKHTDTPTYPTSPINTSSLWPTVRGSSDPQTILQAAWLKAYNPSFLDGNVTSS
jgi:hypothetical protein